MVEKLNILVVEDKPKHIESAKVMFAQEYDLRLATNYYEAIGELNKKSPDVLLTDMNFPLGSSHTSTSDTLEERPLGYAIALYAARPHIAVPRIAILTDSNHHSDAISATFDDFKANKDLDSNELFFATNPFNPRKDRPALKINESYLSMFDDDDTGRFVESEGKNWKNCLDIILKEPSLK